MEHDMESCDKMVKIKASLGLETGWTCEGQVGGFEAMYRVMVKLEQDLAPMDRLNGEEQVMVKVDGSSSHVMI